MQVSDDFSLPFRQLKLQDIVRLNGRAHSHTGEDRQADFVTALFGAIKAAAASKNMTWQVLLSVIDDTFARKVISVLSGIKVVANWG